MFYVNYGQIASETLETDMRLLNEQCRVIFCEMSQIYFKENSLSRNLACKYLNILFPDM